MNPLSPNFNLVDARRFLDFAIEVPPRFCFLHKLFYLFYLFQFTPFYGDTYIEYIRLELLTNGPSRALDEIKKVN